MTIGRLIRRLILAVVVLVLVLSVISAIAVNMATSSYPPTGEFITVPPGTRVHFTDTGGAGEPVVFLHGNPGTLRDGDRFAAALKQDRRVLAVDRPGHGYSDRPAASAPRDQATLLYAVLTQIGTPPSVMVGHSWGGALALICAIENPWDVSGLVLVGARAVARPDSGGAVYGMVRTPVLGSFLRWTVLLPMGRFLVANGLKDAYAPDPAPAEEVAAAQALWLRPGQAEATVWDTANLQDALRTYEKRLDRIRVPVTIIVGDRDSQLAESRELHRLLPRSTLQIVTGAGHMLPKTHAEVIADAVRQQASRRLEQR
jgi:pimeloyl-ACP methyl ester carboxylesterase